MAVQGEPDAIAAEEGAWARPVPARVGETLVAVALLGAAAFFVWQSTGLPFGSLHQPGPGFFPSVLGGVLAALATAILVGVGRSGTELASVHLGHRNVLVTFAALLGAAAAFERLGAYVTLGTLAAILLFALARLAPWRTALWASLGMVAVWALFKVLLGVQLPAGPF
jgi:hypothetical protein